MAEIPDPVEIICDRGDLFTVRDCDEQDGCVVVDHHGQGDIANTMHIPADAVGPIADALQRYQFKGGKRDG